MPWESRDLQTLPEVIGQTYTRQDIILDGKSYQKCMFHECRLIYRGGPARVTSCYIGPNCAWQLDDAAAYVLQFLQEIGSTIAPPGHCPATKPETVLNLKIHFMRTLLYNGIVR